MSRCRYVLTPGAGPPQIGSFMWQWARLCVAIGNGDWPTIHRTLATELEGGETFFAALRKALTQLKNDAEGYAKIGGFYARKPPKPPQAARMTCDLARLSPAELSTLLLYWQQAYGAEAGRLILQQRDGQLVWHGQDGKPREKVPVGPSDTQAGSVWVRFGQDTGAWIKTRVVEGETYCVYATGKSLGRNPLPWRVAAPELAEQWDERLDQDTDGGPAGIAAGERERQQAGAVQSGPQSSTVVDPGTAPSHAGPRGRTARNRLPTPPGMAVLCPVCELELDNDAHMVDGTALHAHCAREATATSGELFPGAAEPEPEEPGDPA